MTFNKRYVYTALNAEKCKKGKNVIVADNLTRLKELVECFVPIYYPLEEINPSTYRDRFKVNGIDYTLAYVVTDKGFRK